MSSIRPLDLSYSFRPTTCFQNSSIVSKVTSFFFKSYLTAHYATQHSPLSTPSLEATPQPTPASIIASMTTPSAQQGEFMRPISPLNSSCVFRSIACLQNSSETSTAATSIQPRQTIPIPNFFKVYLEAHYVAQHIDLATPQPAPALIVVPTATSSPPLTERVSQAVQPPINSIPTPHRSPVIKPKVNTFTVHKMNQYVSKEYNDLFLTLLNGQPIPSIYIKKVIRRNVIVMTSDKVRKTCPCAISWNASKDLLVFITKVKDYIENQEKKPFKNVKSAWKKVSDLILQFDFPIHVEDSVEFNPDSIRLLLKETNVRSAYWNYQYYNLKRASR